MSPSVTRFNYRDTDCKLYSINLLIFVCNLFFKKFAKINCTKKKEIATHTHTKKRYFYFFLLIQIEARHSQKFNIAKLYPMGKLQKVNCHENNRVYSMLDVGTSLLVRICM